MVVGVMMCDMVGQLVVVVLMILFQNCVQIVVVCVYCLVQYLWQVVEFLVWLDEVDCCLGDGVVDQCINDMWQCDFKVFVKQVKVQQYQQCNKYCGMGVLYVMEGKKQYVGQDD